MTESHQLEPPRPLKWAKVIDHDVCIGCHACSTACKSENAVPLSVNRTYVKYVDVGVFPEAHRAFQVTRCNQCDNPPCAIACPTSAMYQRPDGIVDFDKSICIGCKACIAACPYDAIFINPEDHAAEKCNFCAHRLDIDLEPACVVVCPTEAILVGDMRDPASRVAQVIHREPVAVRRPEKETAPKLFYTGARQATLDPLAAQRPEGGLFMWSEQTVGGQHVVSGHPDRPNSAAAAMLAYDVPHQAPWDWRVSAYTWTKGVAAGSYLVIGLAVLLGGLEPTHVLWQWTAPLTALIFLAITGALLIGDLEHPERFYYIFTRPQWRSWLVKGAVIIAAYSAVLVGHLVCSLLGAYQIQLGLLLPGLPLAVMTAVYTAYLFAQAKARDLWQSPLLPPHMLVQALLAGAAVMLVSTTLIATPAAAQSVIATMLSLACGVHLAMVWGEVTLTHATSHARLATEEMTRGRYSWFFRIGLVLTVAGLLVPWLMIPSALAALAGLLLHEHAYVQAGQCVPLA
ncbi:MAG TPA: 4Fe-4S dicluster domain-containing protein [Acidobacteriota bacterium]|nr:4Fe-4S dicluster domain-containing protein [Acidobacteriota bacterium]